MVFNKKEALEEKAKIIYKLHKKKHHMVEDKSLILNTPVKEFAEEFKKRLKKDCHRKGRDCEICNRTNKIIDTLLIESKDEVKA